jgi:hypothetical protein
LNAYHEDIETASTLLLFILFSIKAFTLYWKGLSSLIVRFFPALFDSTEARMNLNESSVLSSWASPFPVGGEVKETIPAAPASTPSANIATRRDRRRCRLTGALQGHR